MPRGIPAFCSFLFFTLLTSPDIFAQPTNHAALIGVGAYPASTGWAALSSANDMELLSLTLQDVGFQAENIQIIQDEQATKKGITDFLLKEVAPQLHKGDFLLLHFSGHGQQAADDNGDEEDELDECWVPFDSPKQFQAGVYEGENLLRDDEIGRILDDLLARVGDGGHIFLSVDACHSGTSTRGLGTARGTDVIMADPATVRTGLFGGSRERTAPPAEMVTSDARKNLIVFTSSSPTQLSYEQAQPGGQFGAYTYEFCRSLRSIEPNATVQALYEEVTSHIQNIGLRQRPTAEGDLQSPLFDGRLSPPVPVFRIAEQRAPDTVRLAVGSLKGVYPGSIMDIYPAGTTDTTLVDPIVSGIITQVTAVTSDLALHGPVTAAEIENSRAYQIFAAPPPIDLSIHLRALSETTSARLKSILKDYPFIRISDLPTRLIVEDSQDSIFLWTSDDRLIWTDQLGPSNGGKLIQAIRRHVEATAMRLIETKDPAYQASVELLIRTENGWEPFTEDQVIEGSKMRLQVTNTGNTPFYYSLVDIQPDDIVVTLIPPPLQDGAIYSLQPGKTWKSPQFDVAPPFGPETIKLICTDKPIRLGQIHNTRGVPEKPHPLEVLYASSFPDIGGTRGITIEEKPAGTGSVHTLRFRIVEQE